MPRPLSTVASGSSSGSAYGAHKRIARWAPRTITRKAIMYPKTVDRCLSLKLPATFRNANTTMPHANSVIRSSVERRLRGPSSVGWPPGAGRYVILLPDTKCSHGSPPGATAAGAVWRGSHSGTRGLGGTAADQEDGRGDEDEDRKRTRLNSSHVKISY